jgi:hypothetical protein
MSKLNFSIYLNGFLEYWLQHELLVEFQATSLLLSDVHGPGGPSKPLNVSHWR